MPTDLTSAADAFSSSISRSDKGTSSMPATPDLLTSDGSDRHTSVIP